MELKDIPEELLAIRIEGLNDGVQIAVQMVLASAANLKVGCSCQIFSRQDVASLLEKVAHEVDAEGVCWEDKVEANSVLGGMPKSIQEKVKRASKKANRARRHIVPGVPWKEALGFRKSDNPTEDQIKKAFRDKAKTLHPDNPEVSSEESFIELKDARDQAMLELHGPKEKEHAPERIIKPQDKPGCPKCGKLAGQL